MKLLWCAMLPLLAGCAAINGRIQEGSGHPYLGAKGDFYSVTHPGDAQDPLTTPFAAIDMPFSAIIDTICLPYDLSKEGKTKKFDPHEKSSGTAGQAAAAK